MDRVDGAVPLRPRLASLPGLLASLALSGALASAGTARAGSPFLEVPAPDVAEASAAYRYANLSNDEALAELDRRKIPYQRVENAPGVRAPVRLTGRLHGVHFHSSLPPEARAKSVFEILDARLALALDDFAALLEEHDVDEVVHFTMYRPNVSPPAKPSKGSSPRPGKAAPSPRIAGAPGGAAEPRGDAAANERPKEASVEGSVEGSVEEAAPEEGPTAAPAEGDHGREAPAPSEKGSLEELPEAPAPKAPGKAAPSDKLELRDRPAGGAKSKAPPGGGRAAPKGTAGKGKGKAASKKAAPKKAASKKVASKKVASKKVASKKASNERRGVEKNAGRQRSGRRGKTARVAGKGKHRREPVRQAPKWAPPGTRHPAGLAIDVGGLRKKDGRMLSVGWHFRGKRGERTCGAGARVPESESARELRAIMCEARARGIFHYVLSPNFDAAHADHFHMEIKPGVRWFLYH